MKCQSCEEPATVHVTNIVNGHKRESHLCKSCAEKQQFLKHQELNLSAILQTVIGQHIGPMTDELSRLTCPSCGIKYMEFKAGGRLGCPNDYRVFQSALEPLLEKIHRSRRHVGKVPPHATKNAARQAELMDFRNQLRQAVETEAYEEAARLRDLIRQKETADEPG
ncbi:MAG: UvrB/UvrC motif-containing protein [Planctomycetes bacterium]|nr:UvrB/UvrC motif-containing protein [Planctomycetota bacterium]